MAVSRSLPLTSPNPGMPKPQAMAYLRELPYVRAAIGAQVPSINKAVCEP